MAELAVKNLFLKTDDRESGIVLVEDASFSVKTSELVVLLGPNGSGKTSLLRGAIGLAPVDSGSAFLNGDKVALLSPIERARRVSYLPQIRPLAWPNLVCDVVALGRYSHGAAIGRLQEKDHEAVERAIKACDLVRFTDRKCDTLSGGELARVHCARAFAAETPLLVADEPVAALDPRHQFRIMDLIRRFVDQGGGALVVLHDIDLAARYADRMIWMNEGRIIIDGPPASTLTEDRLKEVYGVSAQVSGRSVHIQGPI